MSAHSTPAHFMGSLFGVSLCQAPTTVCFTSKVTVAEPVIRFFDIVKKYLKVTTSKSPTIVFRITYTKELLAEYS